jgi:ADP-heptose:LPS heptosyltransferase
MSELKFISNFNNGAFLEISGDTSELFVVKFIDKQTDTVLHTDTLMSGYWTRTNIEYYVDWLVTVHTLDGILVYEHSMNLEDELVLVNITSMSLGDVISWIPYCEEFRKKHNCNLIVKSSVSDLFSSSYPEIIWVKPDDIIEYSDLIYSTYTIFVGIDSDTHKSGIKKLNNFYSKKTPIKFIDNLTFFNRSIHPEHPLLIPLQKISANILGIDFKEIRPVINQINNERPIEKKYVCISEFASANGMKVWQNQIGWKTIVDELKNMGYEVVSISKEKTELKNVIKQNGNRPLSERVWYLQHCEFFIGMSSGLSWLAWASGAKVVLISGHSKKWFEFSENCLRINNENVCNGCHNIAEHVDKFCCYHESFCPENKNFICTRSISPKMVLDEIKNSKLLNLSI